MLFTNRKCFRFPTKHLVNFRIAGIAESSCCGLFPTFLSVCSQGDRRLCQQELRYRRIASVFQIWIPPRPRSWSCSAVCELGVGSEECSVCIGKQGVALFGYGD
ncbi:hypothetical protein GOODEAATRI_014986 [Goodea atripinnis]|uniref:Uncharacterized protein n=1 Tax=Goodea atripinnis TaxID=208336 RepID=A0ABV0NLF8_9TELE